MQEKFAGGEPMELTTARENQNIDLLREEKRGVKLQGNICKLVEAKNATGKPELQFFVSGKTFRIKSVQYVDDDRRQKDEIHAGEKMLSKKKMCTAMTFTRRVGEIELQGTFLGFGAKAVVSESELVEALRNLSTTEDREMHIPLSYGASSVFFGVGSRPQRDKNAVLVLERVS